jgi:hypothetical protein
MDVRVSEERARRKAAPRIRRIRWLGGKGLLGQCLIECAYVRYGLLGGKRWESEAGNTAHKNNPECLFHKFSSHSPKFHECIFLPWDFGAMWPNTLFGAVPAAAQARKRRFFRRPFLRYFLDKRDDFIHERLVQNAVRLPDHERQLFAEQNVGGKFQVTSLTFLFGVRFVGNGPFCQRERRATHFTTDATITSPAQPRSAARSWRRTVQAGCRGAGSRTSLCSDRSGSSCRASRRRVVSG